MVVETSGAAAPTLEQLMDRYVGGSNEAFTALYRRMMPKLSGHLTKICRDPALVCEVTLQPVRRHGVDAAILFSDIMVPLAAAGIDLDITPGVGPVVASPVRTAADVAKPHRVGRRAEVERPPVEDAVDRADDRPAVGGHGGQRQQAHPAQARRHLVGGQAPLRVVDAEQMAAAPGVAGVDQVLERRQVLRRLVHGHKQTNPSGRRG